MEKGKWREIEGDRQTDRQRQGEETRKEKDGKVDTLKVHTEL